MSRPVIVCGIDGDDGKHILITICLNPPEAYASKNQKHLGFIKDGTLVVDKGMQVSEPEMKDIAVAYHFSLEALETVENYTRKEKAT